MNHGFHQWFAEAFYNAPSPSHHRYRYKDRVTGDLTHQQEHLQKVTTRFKTSQPDWIERNLNVLSAIIETAQSRGMQVLLIEAPRMLKDQEAMFGDFWQEYQSHIDSLSTRYQVPYIDLNSEVALEPADFVDSLHVSESGRNKWSSVFFETLRVRLNEQPSS
jgi:hypothetical protein